MRRTLQKGVHLIARRNYRLLFPGVGGEKDALSFIVGGKQRFQTSTGKKNFLNRQTIQMEGGGVSTLKDRAHP